MHQQSSKYIIMLLGIFLLVSRGFANNIYAQLRQQNTKHIIAQQIQHDYTATLQTPGFARSYCVPIEEVTARVVMFHYIRPTHWDPAGSVVANNSITPEQLNQHLFYLYQQQNQGKTKVAFFSELQNRQDYNCFPHRNITLLTADDGWRDNYRYLYPLTQRYNLKFNLGIIYDYASHPTATRIDPFMSHEEIREMIDSGSIEVQSHTLTHGDLSTMPYHEQYQEVCASKQRLEQLFNISINTIVYPVGKYDATTLQLAQSCGYRYGLTTHGGVVEVDELDSSPYELQRIRVTKQSSSEELFGN